MKNIILAMVIVFASVAAASASDKQDDTIRTFVPDQETVIVMDNVFEILW